MYYQKLDFHYHRIIQALHSSSVYFLNFSPVWHEHEQPEFYQLIPDTPASHLRVLAKEHRLSAPKASIHHETSVSDDDGDGNIYAHAHLQILQAFHSQPHSQ